MEIDKNSPEVSNLIQEVFFPYASSKMDNARKADLKFSHYTSAENALKIIKNNEVWLRNSNVMNDFSEIQHGENCIRAAWDDPKIAGRSSEVLDKIQPNLFDQLKMSFIKNRDSRLLHSYLTSISEHGNKESREDLYGRLSMWRAYGGSTNVAFVFKNTPFLLPSDALQAYTSPVLYADEETFKPKFVEVIDNIDKNIALAKRAGAEFVLYFLGMALHFAALSTKHIGFAEEREWRVIYNKYYTLSGKPNGRVKDSIECVGGVPQRVYKIRLENYPEDGFVGATLPELLEEIIIGPTQYPWPIFDALVERLKNSGVNDAEKRVKISNIPLRR
ncbi:DUF2971 domain-containing protein [Ostreiculturibacter nitratireducens]|uniref:DUF2971 domain-containing protein n=1 Tax=Ostreiculturibacter nitratireducens TaxID=3075226 RepID=UPI0031B57AAC